MFKVTMVSPFCHRFPMEDKCQYSHSSWVRRNPCKALWDDYCQTRGLCSNIVTGCEAPVYEMSKLVNITSIISRGYDARKERTSIHGVYKPTCIIGGLQIVWNMFYF